MALEKIPGLAFESQLSFSVQHIKASLENSKLTKNDFRVPQLSLDPQMVKFAVNYNKIVADTKRKITWTNVGKAFGYIPGPSVISGICHIVQGATSKRFSAVMIVRGVFELLGLGILLLIPDLITRAVREHKAKKMLAMTVVTQIDIDKVFYSTVKHYVKAHFAKAP